MALTRRSFIGASAAASAAQLVVGASAPAATVQPPATPVLFDAPVEKSDIVVLGDDLDSDFGIFVRQLSDDVFRRLIAEFPSVRLSTARRLGDGQAFDVDENGDTLYRSLTQQWNTGFRIPSDFARGRNRLAFDLDKFRFLTSHWTQGQELVIGGPVPTKEAFANAQIVGLPELPRGLAWCAHYIDPQSGAAMRVLADMYSLYEDNVLIRYDVMAG